MDKLDRLIDLLNDRIPEIPFGRDAMDEDCPDDWGAVELRRQTDAQWADGHLIDAKYQAEVLLCAADRGSEWLDAVQETLERYDEEDPIQWTLPERVYLYDLNRILWRWQVTLYSPLEVSP